MEPPNPKMLRVGDWCVNPSSGQISRGGEIFRIETRTLRLLECLAEHAGEVVSIDTLLDQVWSDVVVAPDSVYQAVTSLRRLLGDDAKRPLYIETVPRLGYRMVAVDSPWADPPAPPGSSLRAGLSIPAAPGPLPATLRARAGIRWAAVAALCLALLAVFLLYGRTAHSNRSASAAVARLPAKSVAVLPFLDLTEQMNEEPFADGMTEELIGKLSAIPGLQVPSPTSSFYFKGKQIPVAEIAQKLGVAYVLDGSVRKSGGRLRVAARLVRAETGYVVWTESYDRPFNDILMVQDEIAGKVAKALKASIGQNSPIR